MARLELWEIVEVEKLKRFFSHFAVDCVFDVGANRGQYRDLLREHVAFKGPIISFEPMPSAVADMEKKRVNDHGWYIRPIALDRFAGTAAFNIMANDKFSSFKSPNTDEYDKLAKANSVQSVIAVEKSTLSAEIDRFKTQLGFKRPFLKMDTQGNDVAVVESAGNQILLFVGIQGELSVRKLYKDTLYFNEVIAYYEAKGFSLSSIFDNNAGHFPDLLELDCIMYRQLTPETM